MMMLSRLTGSVAVLWFAAFPAQAACSLDDIVALAKAGYTKAEIEVHCKEGGTSTNTDKGSAQLSPEEKAPGTGFRGCPTCPEMAVIPAGSFMMGSPSDEKNGYSSERPQHLVTIAAPFALGKTEVTQAEWEAVMGGNPSSLSDSSFRRSTWGGSSAGSPGTGA
ncbi:MAG: SUMF1/EgtB/PvdO family nonheme iron enzyme [Alphaproteobacteria bacterium]|nr:SUMF1/EgtB/PvdO family nonheme iron enzyme [Alphaproteobacteria bacterium]